MELFTCVAKSPITAVKAPMISIETQKQSQPPSIPRKINDLCFLGGLENEEYFVTCWWNKSE
jgi:hypothetical protein